MTKVETRLRTRAETLQGSKSVKSSSNDAFSKAEKKETNTCSHCAKTFPNKTSLERHFRVHTGAKQYNCTKCDAEFTQPARLKKHCQDKHGPLFECGDCDRWYLVKERLRVHRRVHSGERPFACTKCPKTFFRSGTLNDHIKTHSSARPFACSICDASYRSSSNLNIHMKRHTDQRDYICELCNKSFIRRDGLRKHLECFHYDEKAFQCTICKKSFKGHLEAHMRTHFMEKPHKCPECGSRFVQKSQLNVHLRIHTGVKPYICPTCKVSFTNSTVLRSHMRVHTGEKPFKCLLCKSAFVQLPHLKKHMKCIHGKDKPFVCLPCWVFYKTKRELDAHFAEGKCRPPAESTITETASSTVSQTSVKGAKASPVDVAKAPPLSRCDDVRNLLDGFLYEGKTFDCTICKASFGRPLALDAHMRSHVVPKPFKCRECGICFPIKAQLTRHMKKHTKPHVCPTCNARFAYTANLKGHLRSHTGERPYKCCLCTSAFSHYTSWKKHMRCIHDKDKPFGCKPCYVFYASKGELETHLAEGQCKPAAEGKGRQVGLSVVSHAEDDSEQSRTNKLSMKEEFDEEEVDDPGPFKRVERKEEPANDPQELNEKEDEYPPENEGVVGHPEESEILLDDSEEFDGVGMPLDVLLT